MQVETKERLKQAWGDKAESLNCYAEVKYHDPLSSWACYILAMNPDEEDEISCIISHDQVECCIWRMSELLQRYNNEGEYVQPDHEYRRIHAFELYKILSNKGLR